MNELLYEYRGALYPDYLKRGNACRFIVPTALEFCKGAGVDVGAGRWPFPGAVPVDPYAGGPQMDGCCATDLPLGPHPGGAWDYVFSSHCLEHLPDPVRALEHWRDRLRPGGCLFLYLPHPAMRYWNPQHCRKHLHLFHPEDVAQMVRDLGFVDVIHGERDLAWSFAVVGFKNGRE